jgi:hypothetical protein
MDTRASVSDRNRPASPESAQLDVGLSVDLAPPSACLVPDSLYDLVLFELPKKMAVVRGIVGLREACA